MDVSLQIKIKTTPKCRYFIKWGEMWGSNPRIPEPQSGVLTTSPIPPCDIFILAEFFLVMQHKISIFFLNNIK